MKLFVWNDPYAVSYGGSQVWAVADDVEQARSLACSKKAITMTYGSPSIDQHDWTSMTLKEPTAVYDLPCAIWDEWSE